MSREVHVRFWEGVGVRFPHATRPITSQQQLNKRSEANQAPLKMGLLANNRQHMIRQFNVWGEEVKQFINPNMVSSSRWSIIMDIMADPQDPQDPLDSKG